MKLVLVRDNGFERLAGQISEQLSNTKHLDYQFFYNQFLSNLLNNQTVSQLLTTSEEVITVGFKANDTLNNLKKLTTKVTSFTYQNEPDRFSYNDFTDYNHSIISKLTSYLGHGKHSIYINTFALNYMVNDLIKGKISNSMMTSLLMFGLLNVNTQLCNYSLMLKTELINDEQHYLTLTMNGSKVAVFTDRTLPVLARTITHELVDVGFSIDLNSKDKMSVVKYFIFNNNDDIYNHIINNKYHFKVTGNNQSGYLLLPINAFNLLLRPLFS